MLVMVWLDGMVIIWCFSAFITPALNPFNYYPLGAPSTLGSDVLWNQQPDANYTFPPASPADTGDLSPGLSPSFPGSSSSPSSTVTRSGDAGNNVGEATAILVLQDGSEVCIAAFSLAKHANTTFWVVVFNCHYNYRYSCTRVKA